MTSQLAKLSRLQSMCTRPILFRLPEAYFSWSGNISSSFFVLTTGNCRRRNASPEMPAAGDKRISNGVTRQQSDDEMDANSSEGKEVSETSTQMKHNESASPSKVNETATHSSESELSGAMQFGRFDVLGAFDYGCHVN